MKDSSRHEHGYILAAFSGDYYYIGIAIIAGDFTAKVACRASPTDGQELSQAIGDRITVDS